MFTYVASGGMKESGLSYYVSSYYAYTTTGIMLLKRCGTLANFLPKRLITLLFREGDTAWLKYEAMRGKLRSVWIKRVKIISANSTDNALSVIYFDNLNAAFNTDDLIAHDQAVKIAIAYYQKILNQSRKALECL